jgi:hypothetical protein
MRELDGDDLIALCETMDRGGKVPFLLQEKWGVEKRRTVERNIEQLRAEWDAKNEGDRFE